MQLKIGDKVYNAKKLTGDFPIRFYKETGKDIFNLEREDANPIDIYDTILYLAHALSGVNDSVEEFSRGFTPFDLIGAYGNILDCYSQVTKPTANSEVEKKQQ